MVAWRDFVLATEVSGNTAADCFYTTSDFAAVKLKGDYTGGTDYKDVFSGRQPSTLFLIVAIWQPVIAKRYNWNVRWRK